MPYLPNTDADRRSMLDVIGAESIEELFAPIGEELRFRGELNLPPAMTELELQRHCSEMASQNGPAGAAPNVCFLGGGAYDHFIPAVVDFVASRSEFYTAYTPYQAEASQGSLQAFFEYQTLICELTGMDVSNASLYDGASAAVEGVLMAIAATRREGRVVTSKNVHPEIRETLRTYLAGHGVELIELDAPEGVFDADALQSALTGDTACVLIQHPNFFGRLENLAAVVRAAHDNKSLVVASVNPISLGLLKRPGEYGVDIVVAEGQPLGIPLSYGGPYLGIMACKEEFVRRMPGRIVGRTTDRRGKDCFVLTLQTREQHIRRAKATSNICTNQGLLALRAAVYLAAVGPCGLRQAAVSSAQAAAYAVEKLTAGSKWEAVFDGPRFNEFVLRATGGDVEGPLKRARDMGVFAGIPLGRWYSELADCILVATTEKRTAKEIDALATILEGE